MVEIPVKGGTDRCGVVALRAVEQAVPDQRIDLAVADFDHQTAQAAPSPFAMQTYPDGGRFPDRINLSHWSAGSNGNRNRSVTNTLRFQVVKFPRQFGPETRFD